jgi:spectinomycin phosphotransferase
VLEPPTDLSTDSVGDCLRQEYGLPIDTVTFLPLGRDAGAWVYRAEAGPARYFVKVRRDLVNRAGLIVPRYLADQGVADLVAPLPARDGELFARVGSYVVIVYDYVSDRAGLRDGMSDEQWREYGRGLRQVHDTTLPQDIAALLRVDPFELDGLATVRRVDAHVAERRFDEPGPRKIAEFWRANRDLIGHLVEKAHQLGERLVVDPPPLVLCHADIHTNNVLVASDSERIWIVDWDETMLAPRERDLMFVIGGIGPGFVDARRERLFFEGYGDVGVDPVAMAYYRFNWALADIGAYGEQVFLRPDLGPQDLAEAVERFESLFEPGSIVPIAMASQYH